MRNSGRPLAPGDANPCAISESFANDLDCIIPGSDRIVLILVELEKVRERYNGLDEEVLGDELAAWMYLLTKGFEDEGEVRKMADGFPTIEEFAEKYGFAISDPELKRAYRMADDAERERKRRAKYEARLRREGREEGREETCGKMVAAARAAGVDEATIEAMLAAVG